MIREYGNATRHADLLSVCEVARVKLSYGNIREKNYVNRVRLQIAQLRQSRTIDA